MGEPVTPRVALACRRVTGVSGTTTTLLEHARRLSTQGVSVDMVGHVLDKDRIRDSGATPRKLWTFPWGSSKRFYFAQGFDRWLKRHPCALVHGHGDVTTQNILSLHNSVHAAHEAVHGKPLPEDNAVGQLHRQILTEKRFQKIIANSKMMAQDLERRFGLDPASIAVIYPGHDPRRFRPAPALERLRSDWNIPKPSFLVGLITSGDFEKRGVAPFIAGLTGLAPELKERLFLLVLGKEKDFSPYERAAREAGLAARFSQPVQNVEDFYRTLDLYVHPALYEEFGQSVQEAMACGTPVLVGPRVGAGELLPPSVEEGRARSHTPEEFTARLSRFMALSPEERRNLGRALIPGVAWNTWDENFQRTWEVYTALVPTLQHRGK